MSKFKFLTFAMMIALIFVSGCSKNPEDKNFNTLEELNDPKFIIAAEVGAASEPYVGKVFPKAVEKQFSSTSDMIIALEQGQVDGIVYTKAMLESVLEEKPDTFRILETPVGESEIHMAISPNTKLKNLKDEINEFLKNKKADGTLERLHQYWMVDHKTEMPEIPQIKPPTQKIIVGTFGTTIPSSFYVGEDLRGFDVELIKIFASEYGYEIEFRVEDLVPMLADTEFGKIDIINGSLMYTDERAERVIFPETPLFTLPISVMARKNPDEKTTASIEKLSDLNNPKYKIAAVVGAASEPYVGKVFPNAEEKQFSSVNDIVVALEKGQVDGIVFSKPLLDNVIEEKPDTFRILEPPVGYTEGHMVISPNTKLKNLPDEINEFLKNKKADGTLEKMYQYWLVDHKTEMPDIPQIKTPTQKIIVGTFGTTTPTSFYVGEKLTGFDIELIKRFASEYGYEVEFKVEDIISLLADTEFGKIDIISGSVMYTDERAERIIFPETPLYKFPISVMVRKDSVEKVVTNIEKTADLNNSKYKIAAVVGTASEPYVGKVFPKAVEKQFSSINDMVMALEEGQVDGVVYTVSQLESVIQEKPNKFKILNDPLGITQIYMVSSPNTKFQNLKNEIDEFLKNKKADGTLDRLYKYWMVDHKTEMPKIPTPQNPTKKLIAGTLGTTIPTTFYIGEELAGLDIELTKIFAAEYGYEIEYRVEDFTSLLSDAEFGKVDIISGSIMYTDERAERVVFPKTPLYELAISVMVRKNPDEKIVTPADFNNSKFTVGVVTGSATETFVPDVLPNANLKQFSELNEMILALEERKIDAGAYSRPSLETALKEHPDKLKILDKPIAMADNCMVISPNTKNKNLENEVNKFLAEKKADGTLEKMYQYWVKDKNTQMPNIPEPENPSQVLTVGTSGTIPPYNFYVGEELSGFDIELIKRFAYEYNYKLNYRIEALTSQLTDVEFGKIDMLCGQITYTKERAERVIFAKTPVFSVPSSLIVRNENIVEEEEEENFFSNLKLSFEKTLIREDRYKMILSGLQVTLILSLGSLILGTILGFVFCLLKRSNIKIISTAMNLFIVVISGLPIVLTLMICFYIVFSGTGLGEIAIAIIAFSIDFGCYIAITLNSGIESVDAGEIEAAESLGLSKMQIYRKIILPQAVRNIFGVYRRQVISLVKATSIVGYIAVQDLTKVSDIIRARTYDAFFSLLFTAAIYFIIARIFIYVLDLADSKLNRRKNKNEN